MSFHGLSTPHARRLALACRSAANDLRRSAMALRHVGFDDEAARAAQAAMWLDGEANDIDRRAGVIGDLAGSDAGPTRAVRAAMSWQGTPYQWGGSTPGRGLDCSGLVQAAFARAGVRLPRTSRLQAGAGIPVAGLARARPGDLLFYGRPTHHVGIYVGDGRMVEAPRRGLAVRVVPVRPPTSIRRML